MTIIELCDKRIEKIKSRISKATDDHKLYNLHEQLRGLEAARDYLIRYPSKAKQEIK